MLVGADAYLWSWCSCGEAFKYSKSRTEGIGYEALGEQIKICSDEASVDLGGFYKYKKNAEPHVTSPATVLRL